MIKNKFCGHAASTTNSTDAGQKEGPRTHVQTMPSRTTITLILPKWLFCYVPIVVAVVSIIISATFTITWYMQEYFLLEKSDLFGWEAVEVFSEFDLDGDSFLNIEEAFPLLQDYLGKSKGQGDSDSSSADIYPGEDVVTIEARFSPLNLSTMFKDWQHDVSNNESYYGLFNWLTPNIKTKQFGVSRFLDLLPDLESSPTPGTVYTIVDVTKVRFGSSSLSSDRFYPPRVVGHGSVVHRLLSMLHPRPFLLMRFPPQGILGCVRAINEEYIEVVFRMHIEFQLNEPPRYPFWFTPAQFTGSLLMSRNGSTVKHFHLYVPNERRLNVDMEWLNDSPEDMEVDIGYLPLMELVSIGHSRPQRLFEDSQVHKAENKSYYEETTTTEINWDAEISYEDARDALEVKMYPFKQVRYFNLSEALDHAKAEDKLVHTILLWGALDDQSC
ncbi:hypothetical protein BsWGS_15370 [Bradybaena similaris]